jgi:hypothetical protein
MKSNESTKFWDSEKPIGEVTTDNGVITVKEVTLKGNTYVDIRKWYVERKTDELKPGKGIAIPAEQLEEVVEILNNLLNTEDYEEDEVDV